MVNYSHNIDYCRLAYMGLRNAGAPAITVTRFGDDLYAETKDGSFRRENVRGSRGNLCCKWAAKEVVANEWLEQHSTTKE